MKEDIQSLRDRTRQFAHRIIRLYMALPKTDPAHVLGRQILRSGTSMGAQYREACQQSLMRISFPRWKAHCKNLTKPPTGWNCWQTLQS
ncbi:MAG TPA: four helix bundle protein [bacterium]